MRDKSRIPKTIADVYRVWMACPDDNLPDDGEEVTVVTNHGIFTGYVRYGMIDKEGTPGVVDVVVGGAVSVRWGDVVAWFYFDLEEIN